MRTKYHEKQLLVSCALVLCPGLQDRAMDHPEPSKAKRAAAQIKEFGEVIASLDDRSATRESNRHLVFRALLRRSSQIAAYRRISAHMRAGSARVRQS